MRIRSCRSILFAAATVVCVLVAPQALLAAEPPQFPQEIRAESFENAYPEDLSVIPMPSRIPPSSAYWGRITQKYRSGSYGLWCAGAGGSWNSYPVATAGWAAFDLPQLEDYYSSELEFYYVMPSLGRNDASSFVVSRWEEGATVALSMSIVDLTSTWATRSIVLSDSDSAYNFSRKHGHVRFQFGDHAEGPGLYPQTGEGATIDDVSVTGYKYGPVNSLASSQSGPSVVLTWAKPYRATGSTTPDERTVAYRVWRAPETFAPYTWTELTTSRITATTFTDSTVSEEEDYTYFVQAWDEAPDPGYGEGSMVLQYVTVVPPVVEIDVSADPELVMPGETVTYTYRVDNVSTRTVTSVSVTDDQFGLVGSTASLAPSASYETTYATTYPTTGTKYNTATVTADDDGTPASHAQQVSVVVDVPSVSVEVVATPDPAPLGGTVTLTYTVRNTGPFALTGITVTDPALAGPIVFSDLAPGESEVRAPSPLTASAPFTSSASVIASYGTTTAADAATPVEVSTYERIAGDTRIETAVEASVRAFPSGVGVDTAVLATAWNWPDALGASGLAGAVDGPMLLVNQNDVPTAVGLELARLGVTKVYVIGGTGALGSGVVSDLGDMSGMTPPVRLGGTNRYHTAQLVAEEILLITGDVDTVFVATGANFPDALAASSVAAGLRVPILLTGRYSLPDQTVDALDALDAETIVLCGGTGVVDGAVETALAPYASIEVVRRWGLTRYSTAKSILEWAQPILAPSGPEAVFLAIGSNYPDALAGGVLAAVADGRWNPLMLTNPTVLSTDASGYIQANGTIRHVGALGGTGALSDTVLTSAKGLLP